MSSQVIGEELKSRADADPLLSPRRWEKKREREIDKVGEAKRDGNRERNGFFYSQVVFLLVLPSFLFLRYVSPDGIVFAKVWAG